MTDKHWNICVLQNVKELQKQEKDHQMFPERILSFPGIKNISSFDKLWMCLYCKLKDLCLDSRPSVRKSSGQTLFSTIAAHGSILESNTWQAVLWQVLFPLLDNVIIQSDNASSERVSQSQVGNFRYYTIIMYFYVKLTYFIKIYLLLIYIYLGDFDTPFKKYSPETMGRNQSADHFWCGEGFQYQKKFIEVDGRLQ